MNALTAYYDLIRKATSVSLLEEKLLWKQDTYFTRFYLEAMT